MARETFVSRAKVPPAKTSEKGDGDKNDYTRNKITPSYSNARSFASSSISNNSLRYPACFLSSLILCNRVKVLRCLSTPQKEGTCTQSLNDETPLSLSSI